MKKSNIVLIFIVAIAFVFALNANAKTCTPPPNGLVSWYQAENTGTDSGSGNNATLSNGASYAAAKVGQGFDFDGVDDIAVAPGSPILAFGTNSFTIETWAKADSTNNYNTLFSKRPESNPFDGFTFFRDPSGFLGSHIKSGGLVVLSSDSTMNLGQFYHLALVIDRTSNVAKMYVNGVLQASQPSLASVGSLTNAEPLRIGSVVNSVANPNPAQAFDGQIDEFSIYNRALTTAEILAIYNSNTAGKCQATSIPSPIGLVSWYRAENSEVDSRSQNNGTLINGTTYTNGKVGQSFLFDGNDDNVDLGNWFTYTDFTFEMWVKPGATQVQYADIVDNNHTGSQNWVLQQDSNNTNVYAFSGSPNFSLAADVWQHIAVTHDDSNAVRVYVDGVLVSSGTLVIPYNGTQFLRLGRWGNSLGLPSNRNWNGQIDEFSVYNRALSVGEIQAVYGSSNAGKSNPTSTISPSGQIAWWSGDGNTNDIIGSNNGTLNGADLAIGKIGQAFSFDGIANDVSIPDSPSLNFATNTPLTIELWAYRTSANGIQHLVGKRNNCDGSPINYQIAYASNQIYFGSGAGNEVASGQDLPLNTWTHIAGTFDGSTLRLYLNGVLVGSVNGSLGGTNSSPLLIGGSGTCGKFGGKIDEVSIYNRALAQSEIASILNAGIAGKLKYNTTATGSNVAVNTKSDATITFPTVTTAGNTQQIPIDLSLFPSLPSGITTTGLTYDIATSATFTGSPQVCFNLPSITNLTIFNNLRILHLESNAWINRTDLASINFVTKTICTNSGLTSLSPFAIVNGFAPTAAESTISGRVTSANGRGIRNVVVQISGGNLSETRYVRTNPFGFYRFNGLDVGQTYILNVASKRYSFANPTRVITLNEDLTGEDFVSESK